MSELLHKVQVRSSSSLNRELCTNIDVCSIEGNNPTCVKAILSFLMQTAFVYREEKQDESVMLFVFPILQQLPQDIIRLSNLLEFTANILNRVLYNHSRSMHD